MELIELEGMDWGMVKETAAGLGKKLLTDIKNDNKKK